MFEDRVMGFDSSSAHLASSQSFSSPTRRVNLTPVKLRLREERKRIIRSLDTKYRAIDDHERAIRRFVLIRNNLRRLRREAMEEKQSRTRSNLGCSRISNLSPSCLSSSRAMSVSPMPVPSSSSYDYEPPMSPRPYDEAFVGVPDYLDSLSPPHKKARLFPDDDKENVKDRDEAAVDMKQPLDDTQEILRDLYETCVSEEIISQRAGTPDSSNVNSNFNSNYPDSMCDESDYSKPSSFPDPNYSDSHYFSSYSLSASCTLSNNSTASLSNNASSSDSCYSRSSSPFNHYNCGKSALLGNDLHSVVFHSLITSLES